MYLEWAKPENWGADLAGKTGETKEGHTQRLLLSGKIDGGSTLEVTPYFAKTLKLDEAEGLNKSTDAAKWNSDFCKRGKGDGNWYTKDNSTLLEMWKKAIVVTKSEVKTTAPAAATIEFNMLFGFQPNPTYDILKDTSLIVGMCGGFVDSEGKDVND